MSFTGSFPKAQKWAGSFTILIMAAALMSCQGKSVETSESPSANEEMKPSNTTKKALERATSNALTQSDTQSYLTANPGPNFLTPENINGSPDLAGTTLSRANISPDGTFVTVLQGREDNATQQDLWAYDLETGEGRLLVSSTDLLGGEEVLSEEEKNRRERAREYGSGIISYSWVGQNLLLFPLGGDIYLYDLTENKSQQVTATNGYETDPKVSGDGTKVAYVRENELYIKNLETGLERQLTNGSSDTIRNATASFVVQEELDRNTGYWLSPQADRVAYIQIDEANIAIENRIDFGADGVANIAQRYPFAGTDNATVKLGIVSTSGGTTRWLDLGDNPDVYLTRVGWASDGSSLIAGVLSRDHKTHTFYKFDARSGQREIFYTETSPTWLNIGIPPIAVEDGGFIWTAQRNDKRQVFNLTSEGEVSELTPDTLNTGNLLCHNKATGELYVSGWSETPLERHIFKVSTNAANPQLGNEKNGSEAKTVIEAAVSPDGPQDNIEEMSEAASAASVTQITKRSGQHNAKFNSDCSRYIGTFHGMNTPPQTRAFKSDGTALAWLNENKLDESHPYTPYLANHIEPEFGQIKADDGTMLDYRIFKPVDLKPGEKRASVTIVYGGPGVQRVQKEWRIQKAQMLAHHGFVVFQLDNRGATNRGKVFEDGLYRAMGNIEVKDQAVGAEFLKSQSYIDPNRMGVYGWSYGGYMTLHMLGQTDHYKSGVSGAPVTEWSLYDTAYTERYLGSPVEGDANYTAGAYENASVFAHMDGLTEPFLLIHGMADDNVVFRHSIRLMDEVQTRGAQNMRVMTYPGEKHGFRKIENKIHRDRQILEFFLETLETEN